MSKGQIDVHASRLMVSFNFLFNLLIQLVGCGAPPVTDFVLCEGFEDNLQLKNLEISPVIIGKNLHASITMTPDRDFMERESSALMRLLVYGTELTAERTDLCVDWGANCPLRKGIEVTLRTKFFIPDTLIPFDADAEVRFIAGDVTASCIQVPIQIQGSLADKELCEGADCGFNGECIEGVCYCVDGFTGSLCETPPNLNPEASRIPPLQEVSVGDTVDIDLLSLFTDESPETLLFSLGSGDDLVPISETGLVIEGPRLTGIVAGGLYTGKIELLRVLAVDSAALQGWSILTFASTNMCINCI